MKYEQILPSWTAARDALGKARQVEAVEEQTKEAAFDELAQKYPGLRDGV